MSADVGGVFVTRDLASVRYLTGFSGSNATVVIGTDEVHLVTDGRYREQAHHESPDVVAVIDRDVVGALRGLCTGREIALDDRTPVGLAQQLTEAGLEVRAVADPVAPLRMVKDPQELDALSRARQTLLVDSRQPSPNGGQMIEPSPPSSRVERTPRCRITARVTANWPRVICLSSTAVRRLTGITRI